MACVDEAGPSSGKGEDKPTPKHYVILSYIYEGANVAILFVAGFPWFFIERSLMKDGIAGRLLVAVGFAINGIALFGITTFLAGSYEVGGLSGSVLDDTMQKAANLAPFCFILGWFLGMSCLVFAELFDFMFNKEREDCDAAFSRVILAKYGFKLKFNIGAFPRYNFAYWATACVVGALFAEMCKYIGQPKTTVACSNNHMTTEACVALVGNATALMDSRGNCCQILDKRFDIGTFLANAGGVGLASWAIASGIATHGINAYGIGTPIEKGD